MAKGYDLYPGSGAADELIYASAMAPIAQIPQQMHQNMLASRRVALAEEEARRQEAQRRFDRERIERERRILAAGGAGGQAAAVKGKGGAAVDTSGVAPSGDIGGVRYSARSLQDVLAGDLEKSTSALQAEELRSADAMMERLLAGKRRGDLAADEAAAAVPSPWAAGDPDEIVRAIAEANVPAGEEEHRQLMSTLAGLDESAAAEGVDATGLIRSLIESGVIPEEAFYSGTSAEAARQVSSLLAGLTPGELQRRKEDLPGWADVDLGDFERVLDAAKAKGAAELNSAMSEARATAVEQSRKAMDGDPTLKNLGDGAKDHLASLEVGGKDSRERAAKLRAAIGGYTEREAMEAGQTERKRIGEDAATERTRKTQAGTTYRTMLGINEDRRQEAARAAAINAEGASAADAERNAAVETALVESESAAASAEDAYSGALRDASARGMQNVIHSAQEMWHRGDSQADIINNLTRMYPGYSYEDIQAASDLPFLRVESIVASDEAAMFKMDLQNFKKGSAKPPVSDVAVEASNRHAETIETLAEVARGQATDPYYRGPQTALKRETLDYKRKKAAVDAEIKAAREVTRAEALRLRSKDRWTEEEKNSLVDTLANNPSFADQAGTEGIATMRFLASQPGTEKALIRAALQSAKGRDDTAFGEIMAALGSAQRMPQGDTESVEKKAELAGLVLVEEGLYRHPKKGYEYRVEDNKLVPQN